MANNFRWNHSTSQLFGCLILHDKPITHTLLNDVTYLKTSSLLSILPCGELFCCVRNFEEMYLDDKSKWITMNIPLYQKSHNFKCNGYFSHKGSLRIVDSLNVKQAQMGDRGIKRSVIFVERAPCHTRHQLFIISKVFTEVKFKI